MTRKDLRNVIIIGAAVGLFFQPIADNLIKGSGLLSKLVGGQALSPLLRGGIFLFFLFLAPAALWVASVLGKWHPVVYQFAKFAAVGTLNTFINSGILNLQSLFFGITSGPLISVSAAVSFLAATTNSFFWNKFWTFGGAQSKSRAEEAVKFYFISIGGLALDVGAVYAVVNYLRPEVVSPQIWLNVGGLAGVAASFLWNFFGYKYIVFKNMASGVGVSGN